MSTLFTQEYPFHIQQRTVPAQQIACILSRAYASDLEQTILEGTTTLQSVMEQQHIRPSGPPMVIYHGEVSEDCDGPFEICLPYEGQLAAGDEISVRQEPAHHEAFLTLTKEEFTLKNILNAYDAAHDFARDHGTSGPLHCREIQICDLEKAHRYDPVSEIAWPFTPTETSLAHHPRAQFTGTESIHFHASATQTGRPTSGAMLDLYCKS